MKYKILFVTLFPQIGGAETSLVYVLQKLDRKRFEPIVLLPKEGYLSERIKPLGIRMVFLELPGFLIRQLFVPGINPFAVWKFYQLCKEIQPHVIHLNHTTLACYTGIVSKLLHIPVVAISWVNSDSIYAYQDIATNFGTDAILAITPKLQKRITRNGVVKKEKVMILTPGVDTQIFRPTTNKVLAKKDLGINPDSVTIGIASRFDPVKDHLTFFTAMNIVAKIASNITILVAQDPSINLEEKNTFAPIVKKNIDVYLANNPTVKERVVFVGYKQNMLPFYQATDILVSSSLYEGLGMIHMEGASCGLPIVSTNFDGQHIIVKNGRTGYLVPIRTPKLLAEKILTLVQNKRLREQFGAEARAHILKNFSIERYTKKVQDVYLGLVRPPAGG